MYSVKTNAAVITSNYVSWTISVNISPNRTLQFTNYLIQHFYKKETENQPTNVLLKKVYENYSNSFSFLANW